MSQKRFLGAAVVALTCVTASISTGQTPPVQEWSIVTTVQIKPEFRVEYEGVQKDVSAVFKKANVPRFVVQTILGDLDEYITITPLAKYAELDGQSVLAKAMGDAGSQKILRRIGGYLLGVHRVTTLAMNDISIRTPGDQGEYAHVTTWRLAPGKAGEFTEFMKNDYLPAMKKADVANLWLSRPIFGGDLDERVMVRLMHKMAELDAGPLTTKALGADGARQLGIKQAAIIRSTNYRVVHLRTDLSNIPAPQAAKAGE